MRLGHSIQRQPAGWRPALTGARPRDGVYGALVGPMGATTGGAAAAVFPNNVSGMRYAYSPRAGSRVLPALNSRMTNLYSSMSRCTHITNTISTVYAIYPRASADAKATWL